MREVRLALFLGEGRSLRKGLDLLLNNIEDKPEAYGLTHEDVWNLQAAQARCYTALLNTKRAA